MEIQSFLESTLPHEVIGTLVSNPRDWAFRLMLEALTEVFGRGGWRKDKVPSKADAARMVTYVWAEGGSDEA